MTKPQARSTIETWSDSDDTIEQLRLLTEAIRVKPSKTKLVVVKPTTRTTDLKYPAHTPWAALEGNYAGQIEWSDLAKNAKKLATSDDDAESLKGRLLHLNPRQPTALRSAPGVLKRRKD